VNQPFADSFADLGILFGFLRDPKARSLGDVKVKFLGKYIFLYSNSDGLCPSTDAKAS
jgi:hypothetical protein